MSVNLHYEDKARSAGFSSVCGVDASEYDERYPENNLDTILTDNPLNDSLIEE